MKFTRLVFVIAFILATCGLSAASGRRRMKRKNLPIELYSLISELLFNLKNKTINESPEYIVFIKELETHLQSYIKWKEGEHADDKRKALEEELTSFLRKSLRSSKDAKEIIEKYISDYGNKEARSQGKLEQFKT